MSMIVFAVAGWNESFGPSLSQAFINKNDANDLVKRNHRWITYDPLSFDPFLSSSFNTNLVQKELGWIHKAGFYGIITFTSKGDFGVIPELAKKAELSVIMGVWDPTDPQEVEVAISKKAYVYAYCVGHNGLNERYYYDDLVKTIQYIRFRTNRPVSTTEKLCSYKEDGKLLEVGDWIFPDCHVSVEEKKDSAMFVSDATRDSKSTIQMAKEIAELNGKSKKPKPILLKMVTYPTDGITDDSLKEQSDFFVKITDSKRDSLPDLPSNVAISVHSAFDIKWKKAWPFYTWDTHTGLLNSDGTLRPAAKEIVERSHD